MQKTPTQLQCSLAELIWPCCRLLTTAHSLGHSIQVTLFHMCRDVCTRYPSRTAENCWSCDPEMNSDSDLGPASLLLFSATAHLHKEVAYRPELLRLSSMQQLPSIDHAMAQVWDVSSHHTACETSTHTQIERINMYMCTINRLLEPPWTPELKLHGHTHSAIQRERCWQSGRA